MVASSDWREAWRVLHPHGFAGGGIDAMDVLLDIDGEDEAGH